MKAFKQKLDFDHTLNSNYLVRSATICKSNQYVGYQMMFSYGLDIGHCSFPDNVCILIEI